MTKLIGGIAGFLGWLMRLFVHLVPLLLIVWGVWLFDSRLAPIVAGTLLYLDMRPKDRRKP